ncbi:hypothetical protein FPQ18DRAFT_306531 [Pyronema domesticum]|nr:hypothetical protein FPQ18DRAFT_306531 [Pyronema domesticum]
MFRLPALLLDDSSSRCRDGEKDGFFLPVCLQFKQALIPTSPRLEADQAVVFVSTIRCTGGGSWLLTQIKYTLQRLQKPVGDRRVLIGVDIFLRCRNGDISKANLLPASFRRSRDVKARRTELQEVVGLEFLVEDLLEEREDTARCFEFAQLSSRRTLRNREQKYRQERGSRHRFEVKDGFHPFFDRGYKNQHSSMIKEKHAREER